MICFDSGLTFIGDLIVGGLRERREQRDERSAQPDQFEVQAEQNGAAQTVIGWSVKANEFSGRALMQVADRCACQTS